MSISQVLVQYNGHPHDMPEDDPGEILVRGGWGAAPEVVAAGVAAVLRGEGMQTRTRTSSTVYSSEPAPCGGTQHVATTTVVTSPWTLPDPE